MRSYHRRAGRRDHIVEGLVSYVRDVHHHSYSVHFFDNVASEIRQTVVMLDVLIVYVAFSIRPFICVRVSERHIMDSQLVKHSQLMKAVVDRVAAFDPHKGRDLSALYYASNVGRR